MAARWQLSWLNFKNMKGRYFAPWILCYLLLPAMVHFRKMSLIGELYFEDAFFPFVRNLTEQFFPLVIIWYSYLFFREKYDTGAEELFSVYQNGRYSLPGEALLVWAHSLLMIAPLLFLYCPYLGEAAAIFLRYAAHFWMLEALFVLCVSLFHTTLPGLLLCLGYHLSSLFIHVGSTATWNLYFYDFPLSWETVFPKALWALGMGALFAVAGGVWCSSAVPRGTDRVGGAIRLVFYGPHRRRWVAGLVVASLLGGWGLYQAVKPQKTSYTYREAQKLASDLLSRNGIDLVPGSEPYREYAELASLGAVPIYDSKIRDEYQQKAVLDYYEIVLKTQRYNAFKEGEDPVLDLSANMDTSTGSLTMLLWNGAPAKYTGRTLHDTFRRELCTEVASQQMLQWEYYREVVENLTFEQLETKALEALDEGVFPLEEGSAWSAERLSLDRDLVYAAQGLNVAQKLQVLEYARLLYIAQRAEELGLLTPDWKELGNRRLGEVGPILDALVAAINADPSQEQRNTRYTSLTAHLGIWSWEMRNW